MSTRPQLDTPLRKHYNELFTLCRIDADKQALVDKAAQRIEHNHRRYASAVIGDLIPWWFVGVVHTMESSGDFTTHLHNGDSLKARTVQVPKGRPLSGTPPFLWEISARDALMYAGLTRVQTWDIAQALYRFEDYNGWGYYNYHPEVNSPYLWSMTNHYTRGKYIADGTYSTTAVSKQIGAAALLRRLMERGLLVHDNAIAPRHFNVAFSNRVTVGAEDLQMFLNRHGAVLRVDGRPGMRTSDAFKKLFGRYLPNDPRLKV